MQASSDNEGLKNTVLSMAGRPYQYASTRDAFLAMMYGIVLGRYGCLLIPGPDFTQFYQDLEQTPDRAWAEPVVKYVVSCL